MIFVAWHFGEKEGVSLLSPTLPVMPFDNARIRIIFDKNITVKYTRKMRIEKNIAVYA